MADLLDKKFEKDVLEAYEAELPKSKGIDYVTNALIDVGREIGSFDITKIFDNYDFENIEEDVYEMLIDYVDYLVAPEHIESTWRDLCADYSLDNLLEYVDYDEDKEEIERHYDYEIEYDGFGPILAALIKNMYLDFDMKWFNDLESVYIDAIEKVFDKKVEMLDD